MDFDLFQAVRAFGKSAAVNLSSASGDQTIVSIRANRRFSIMKMWLQTGSTSVDVTVKSGSTAISGPITLNANSTRSWGDGTSVEFNANALGDDIVLNLSTSADLKGYIFYIG